jgi:hypothetical protein
MPFVEAVFIAQNLLRNCCGWDQSIKIRCRQICGQHVLDTLSSLDGNLRVMEYWEDGPEHQFLA